MLAGYTGVDCEVEIDECSSNPCKNGGTCINDINKFYCSCIGHQTGKYCDGGKSCAPTDFSVVWKTSKTYTFRRIQLKK